MTRINMKGLTMNKLAWVLLALTLGMAYLDNRNFHERNMVMAENAFATGCSAHAILRCSQNDNVLLRGSCYEDAYVNCPIWGKSFREGIEAAGK